MTGGLAEPSAHGSSPKDFTNEVRKHHRAADVSYDGHGEQDCAEESDHSGSIPTSALDTLVSAH